FQFGACCSAIYAIFRHVQQFVFRFWFVRSGGLCSSHFLLLHRRMVWPHIDATTEWLITSFVAGDISMIQPSGCEILNSRRKNSAFRKRNFCTHLSDSSYTLRSITCLTLVRRQIEFP